MFQNEPPIWVLPGALGQDVIDEMQSIADKYDEMDGYTAGAARTRKELALAFEHRGYPAQDWNNLSSVQEFLENMQIDDDDTRIWQQSIQNSLNNMQSVRRCKRIPIDLNIETWLSSMVYHHGNQANMDWGFDLQYTHQAEFLEYGEEGAKYDWHVDTSIVVTFDNQEGEAFDHAPTMQRKITLIWQLSDPDDYEGGDLQLTSSFDGANMLEHSKDLLRMKGSIIAFPSFMIHRITPIVSGCRKSMVSWVAGPSWR